MENSDRAVAVRDGDFAGAAQQMVSVAKGTLTLDHCRFENTSMERATPLFDGVGADVRLSPVQEGTVQLHLTGCTSRSWQVFDSHLVVPSRNLGPRTVTITSLAHLGRPTAEGTVDAPSISWNDGRQSGQRLFLFGGQLTPPMSATRRVVGRVEVAYGSATTVVDAWLGPDGDGTDRYVDALGRRVAVSSLDDAQRS